MTFPLTPFFKAKVTPTADLTPVDKLMFMGMQQRALMKGVRYLKEKTIRDLENGIFWVHVRKSEYELVGQCLLTDAKNTSAAYIDSYPAFDDALAMTSLYVDGGHSTPKGSLPAGMGPTSTLFRLAEYFAAQNGYKKIIAKTNRENEEGHKTFLRMGFTASLPVQVDNEGYMSVFYTKTINPAVALQGHSLIS